LQIEHNLLGGRLVGCLLGAAEEYSHNRNYCEQLSPAAGRMRDLNQGSQILAPADLTLDRAFPSNENDENFQLADLILLASYSKTIFLELKFLKSTAFSKGNYLFNRN